MTALYLYALMAMNVMAPNRDHEPLARAIAVVVETEEPLFRNDESRIKTLSLLLSVAFRESSFRNDAIGDHGQSYCAFQLHRSSGGSRALLDDPEACTRTAFAMLRESIRVDRENPVAHFARGPRYRSEEARRLSRDRMWLARRIAGER